MIRNTFLNIDAELYNNRKIESLLIFVYLKKEKLENSIAIYYPWDYNKWKEYLTFKLNIQNLQLVKFGNEIRYF